MSYLRRALAHHLTHSLTHSLDIYTYLISYEHFKLLLWGRLRLLLSVWMRQSHGSCRYIAPQVSTSPETLRRDKSSPTSASRSPLCAKKSWMLCLSAAESSVPSSSRARSCSWLSGWAGETAGEEAGVEEAGVEARERAVDRGESVCTAENRVRRGARQRIKLCSWYESKGCSPGKDVTTGGNTGGRGWGLAVGLWP
jgi:hypothetical protein